MRDRKDIEELALGIRATILPENCQLHPAYKTPVNPYMLEVLLDIRDLLESCYSSLKAIEGLD